MNAIKWKDLTKDERIALQFMATIREIRQSTPSLNQLVKYGLVKEDADYIYSIYSINDAGRTLLKAAQKRQVFLRVAHRLNKRR